MKPCSTSKHSHHKLSLPNSVPHESVRSFDYNAYFQDKYCKVESVVHRILKIKCLNERDLYIEHAAVAQPTLLQTLAAFDLNAIDRIITGALETASTKLKFDAENSSTTEFFQKFAAPAPDPHEGLVTMFEHALRQTALQRLFTYPALTDSTDQKQGP